MQPAIQNLDYLRQLIAEIRQAEPYRDMERLRMLYGYDLGTGAMTNKQEDR
jgi:hypothetical protein